MMPVQGYKGRLASQGRQRHWEADYFIYLERARIFLLLRFRRRIRFLRHFSRMVLLKC